MSPLRKAIDAAGGVATAAKICEVSPRAIYKWLATGSLPRGVPGSGMQRHQRGDGGD